MTSATDPSMTVVVSGATGLIGTALVKRLSSAGYNVKRLMRLETSSSIAQPGDISWNPPENEIDAVGLAGCDAIIHLAGEPIAQRWTSDAKRAIRESRVQGTLLLARTVAAMAIKPKVFLSGSAVGFYGNRGDERLDESSEPGNDFLASVVQDWESSAASIADAGVRLVYLRSGLVLSGEGGALGKMLPPFKLGMGGPMGDGNQWMSWISLDDHVSAMLHALTTERLRGPVNLVTPNAVRNAEFTETLGRVLGRPAVIPVPRFALKLMFGEMAEATILSGQHVLPEALVNAGFGYAHPSLEMALHAVLMP